MKTKAPNRGKGGVFLVTHRGPDNDAITCGTNAFLRDDVWFNRGGDVGFVGPNEEYRGSVPAGYRLEHADVSGKYDPDRGFFDHHLDNWPEVRKTWPSAAGMILAHSKKLQTMPAVVDLTYLADKVDTASTGDDESVDSRNAREELNGTDVARFNRIHNANVFVVAKKRGPTYLPQIISNLEIVKGEISDKMKMKIGMHLMRAWVGKESGWPIARRKNRADEKVPSDCEIVIVMPFEQNFKNDIALFMWLLANELDINDSKICYVLVNQGERFSGQAPKNARIVHIGTGGKYDPETDDFDSEGLSNGMKKTFFSAAVMVFNKYRKSFQTTPIVERAITDLVKLTKDQAPLTQEQQAWIEHDRQMIQEKVNALNNELGYNLILIENPRGPEYLADLFERLEVEEGELSTRELIDIKMYGLNSWYNKKIVIPVLETLIQRAEKITKNGLNFIIIPETFLSSKTVRQYLRANYKKYADVCIANYLDPARGFGVTRLFEDGKVAGMEDLAKNYTAIDPTLKQRDGMYLTDRSFALYLTRKLVIDSFETVRALALQTLRSAEAAA
ncbi:MAG: hypothetical protein V1928_00320 [Parcubacteria group bacterium]